MEPERFRFRPLQTYYRWSCLYGVQFVHKFTHHVPHFDNAFSHKPVYTSLNSSKYRSILLIAFDNTSLIILTACKRTIPGHLHGPSAYEKLEKLIRQSHTLRYLKEGPYSPIREVDIDVVQRDFPGLVFANRKRLTNPRLRSCFIQN